MASRKCVVVESTSSRRRRRFVLFFVMVSVVSCWAAASLQLVKAVEEEGAAEVAIDDIVVGPDPELLLLRTESDLSDANARYGFPELVEENENESEFEPTTNGNERLFPSPSTSLPQTANVGRALYIVNEWGTVSRRLGVTRFTPAGIAWATSPISPLMRSVAVGAPYGAVWGITKKPASMGGFQPTFKNILSGVYYPTSFGLMQLDVGGPDGRVWGVSASNQVYFRAFASPTSPGISWVPIVSLTIRLSQISVGGGFGDVFGLGIIGIIGSGGRFVYYREGITKSNPYGTGWRWLGAQRLVWISVGGGFGDSGLPDDVDGPEVLRLADGTYIDDIAGSQFDSRLPEVWGVGASGLVYRRTGITRANRAGTSWEVVSAFPPMRSVTVNGDASIVYGTSTERVADGYRIYYFVVNGGRFWIPLGGITSIAGAVSIAAF